MIALRVLKFIVNGQIIQPDPNCDFSNLIPGSEGYIKAEFSFSSDWNGCVKVAEFFSMMGREYPCQILKDGKSCAIPTEALLRRSFKIRVIGKNKEYKIKTDKVVVDQNGGKL